MAPWKNLPPSKVNLFQDETVDRFKRSNPLGDDPTEGGRNLSVQRVPYFLYPAINYNSHNDPTVGWNDPELAGVQGVMGRFRPRVNFADGRTPNITQDVRWTNAATGGAWFCGSFHPES